MNAAAHARLDLDYTNNREMTCITLENFVAVKVSTNKFSCFFCIAWLTCTLAKRIHMICIDDMDGYITTEKPATATLECERISRKMCERRKQWE